LLRTIASGHVPKDLPPPGDAERPSLGRRHPVDGRRPIRGSGAPKEPYIGLQDMTSPLARHAPLPRANRHGRRPASYLFSKARAFSRRHRRLPARLTAVRIPAWYESWRRRGATESESHTRVERSAESFILPEAVGRFGPSRITEYSRRLPRDILAMPIFRPWASFTSLADPSRRATNLTTPRWIRSREPRTGTRCIACRPQSKLISERIVCRAGCHPISSKNRPV